LRPSEQFAGGFDLIDRAHLFGSEAKQSGLILFTLCHARVALLLHSSGELEPSSIASLIALAISDEATDSFWGRGSKLPHTRVAALLIFLTSSGSYMPEVKRDGIGALLLPVRREREISLSHRHAKGRRWSIHDAPFDLDWLVKIERRTPWKVRHSSIELAKRCD
jgi:hypothetical protein